MEVEEVLGCVRRVAGVCADADAVLTELEASLANVRSVRAFCDAAEAEIARRIAEVSSFPEAMIAESSRGSLGVEDDGSEPDARRGPGVGRCAR
ncbi:hypothetical protein [Ilumatobacter nonamiensis]|uniref:hypothetical protein n=1 Tax=Ilumatobacter nonamiensis TaxID=467093 RepID=UPI00034BE8BF|nr:hypothetical protein [Ilumatobacter nonamiensis]